MQTAESDQAARQALAQKILEGSLAFGSGLAPVRQRDRRSLPLSSWQMHVWDQAQLAAKLSPGVQLFNESITVHYRGSLEVAVLKRALDEIVRRHEAWRTSFKLEEGGVREYVHHTAEMPLLVDDLRSLPLVERLSTATRLGTQDAHEPFSLEDGPLVKARLVQLSDTEWRLLLTAHQIVLDGISVYRVFLPELTALYRAFSENQPSPLRELPLQYSDYAVWEQERLAAGISRTGHQYWREQLQSLPRLCFPTDRPRPAQRTFHGSVLPFSISRQTSDLAREFSRREGVTLFTTLLSVFFALLHSYTGQEDLVTGTVAPVRPRSELQNLLGYFLNPVVLRLKMPNEATFAEILKRARRVLLEAMSYSDVPFDFLAQEIEPAFPLDRHPLYQVQISLEPPLPALDEAWGLTPMDCESGGAKLDLYMVFDDRPAGLIGRVQYNPDLFDKTTMERLVAHYTVLLQLALTAPWQRLSAFPQFRLLN